MLLVNTGRKQHNRYNRTWHGSWWRQRSVQATRLGAPVIPGTPGSTYSGCICFHKGRKTCRFYFWHLKCSVYYEDRRRGLVSEDLFTRNIKVLVKVKLCLHVPTPCRHRHSHRQSLTLCQWVPDPFCPSDCSSKRSKEPLNGDGTCKQAFNRHHWHVHNYGVFTQRDTETDKDKNKKWPGRIAYYTDRWQHRFSLGSVCRGPRNRRMGTELILSVN